jgi:flavin-dependent thymidylate synthase|tara:strand:+ start:5081 stop:5734 length:654 start_codon:yes stop_codon:yes gene_type:complete
MKNLKSGVKSMNNNTVELLGHYGDDEIHACSAWTSTSRKITNEKRDRIPKLLTFLAEAGHHTPFEKSSLHFLVDTDIASHIHLLKHRVGVSVNAESARYKELKEDKCFVPDDWTEHWQHKLADYTQQGNDLYHECVADLEPILGRARAKESARFFKTYNSQICADVMFNWRSFYHFQKLRNKPDAQKEIREIAQLMLDTVKGIEDNPFQHTINAFGL